MRTILAAAVLLATVAAPVQAMELPALQVDIVCPPVTLAEFLPDVPPEPPEDPDIPEYPGYRDPPDADPADTEVPEPEPASDCTTPFVYEMGSPLMLDVAIASSFGAPRPPDRLHKGIDLGAPQMTPVFAVSDGVVSWISDTCCDLAIEHPDRWHSYYIHLNNDSATTDDGLGTGIAPGIVEGATVRQGQLIGWIGDSGNAEPTIHHLHFELRMPNGESIDAAPSLRAAEAPLPPALPIQPELPEDGTVPIVERYPSDFAGPFADDDGHPLEWLFDLMASWGLLAPCDDSGVLICPDAIPTGAEFAALLSQAGFASPDRPNVYDGSTFTTPTPAATSGVEVRGCGTRRFCPDQPISTVEARGILRRSSSPEWLAPVIRTVDCGLAADRSVSRAQLLLRLASILGVTIDPPCDLID